MTFHGKMLEAKHAKREAANRGLSRGNQGMRPLTKSERAAIDPAAGSWGRLLAETKIAWCGARTDAIETYRFAHHEIRGDSLYAGDLMPAGGPFTLAERLWRADRV